MLGKDKLFARARALINKPKPVKHVSTPELEEYVGAPINTPRGEGRIEGVVYAHSRRVEGRTIRYYAVLISLGDTAGITITTEENTQWEIN